jgi:hypothetical protein
VTTGAEGAAARKCSPRLAGAPTRSAATTSCCATRTASALTAASTMPPSRIGDTRTREMIFNQQPEMQRCPETPANGVPRHHNRAPGGIRTPNLLIRRSGQIVRGHPLPSGLGVRVREMVQVVPLVPAWVAVSVAVSPDDDCFLPNPGRMTADLPTWICSGAS